MFWNGWVFFSKTHLKLLLFRYFVYSRFWCIWPYASKSAIYKLIISHKLKVTQKNSLTRKFVSEQCASFLYILATFDRPFFYLWHTWNLRWHTSILQIQSTITEKIKMGKLSFIRFSTVGIFHVNVATSEEGEGSAYPYLGHGLCT